MDKNKEKLLSLIDDVTWGFFRVLEGYSGRGMIGRESPLAFTSGIFPHSDRGQRLTRELFLTWDAYNGEWVYYYYGFWKSWIAPQQPTFRITRAPALIAPNLEFESQRRKAYRYLSPRSRNWGWNPAWTSL